MTNNESTNPEEKTPVTAEVDDAVVEFPMPKPPKEEATPEPEPVPAPPEPTKQIPLHIVDAINDVTLIVQNALLNAKDRASVDRSLSFLIEDAKKNYL